MSNKKKTKPTPKPTPESTPEPTPEPEPEIVVEDDTRKDRLYQKLRPLDEPEFDPKPYIIFGLICGPILFIYIGITCYCKNKRSQRKELEQKRKSKGSTVRTETENDLMPTEANVDREDKVITWKLDHELPTSTRQTIERQKTPMVQQELERANTDKTDKAET